MIMVVVDIARTMSVWTLIGLYRVHKYMIISKAQSCHALKVIRICCILYINYVYKLYI